MVGLQRCPHPAEAGFKEAVDGVAVVGPFMAGEALSVPHRKTAKISRALPKAQGEAQVGLDLLAETAGGVLMAGRAGQSFVTGVHGAFGMEPLANRQCVER